MDIVSRVNMYLVIAPWSSVCRDFTYPTNRIAGKDDKTKVHTQMATTFPIVTCSLQIRDGSIRNFDPEKFKKCRILIRKQFYTKKFIIPPYCGACTYIRNSPIFQGEKSASYIGAPLPVSYSSACPYIRNPPPPKKKKIKSNP